MDDADKLIAQMTEKIILEKRGGKFVVAPTAPSNFKETTEVLLANRIHTLFDIPYISAVPDSEDIEKRIKNLGIEPIPIKDCTTKKVTDQPIKCEEKQPPPDITDPELLAMWKQFNLSSVKCQEEDTIDYNDEDLFDELNDDDFSTILEKIISE